MAQTNRLSISQQLSDASAAIQTRRYQARDGDIRSESVKTWHGSVP
jgi:hypothetical protein